MPTGLANVASLASMVRLREANAQEFAGTLRIDAPLEMPVPPALALCLSLALIDMATGRLTEIPARVVASQIPSPVTAVLVADFPAIRLAYGSDSRRWAMGLLGANPPVAGFAGTHGFADLKAFLVYRRPTGAREWSINRSWLGCVGGVLASLRRR